MDLSIIIINHNTKKLVIQTINSIISTVKDADFEVVVADNSTDKDEKYMSNHFRVKVIDIQNKGFSSGCNLAATGALGDYLLFLNSDSILKENTVDRSLSLIKEDKDIGVLGVKQLLPDGSLDHGCKRGFPTPLNSLYYFLGIDRIFPQSKRFGAYRQTFVKEDDVSDVDSISGAYMMIEKAFFEEIGGFDEDYFMYGEDVDLCYRIKKAGKRVVYCGDVSFVHIKGQSGINNRFVLKHFYKSMRIFYDKHYKDKYSRFVTFLVHLGIDIKYKLADKELKRRAKS